MKLPLVSFEAIHFSRVYFFKKSRSAFFTQSLSAIHIQYCLTYRSKVFPKGIQRNTPRPYCELLARLPKLGPQRRFEAHLVEMQTYSGKASKALNVQKVD